MKDDPTKKELVEALHVEWCKVYARMCRWHEDVVLVEEMHRTIEYGYWSAVEWVPRIPQRARDVSMKLLEGLTAYGWEQESCELRTCKKLTEKWAAIHLQGQAFLAKETAAVISVHTHPALGRYSLLRPDSTGRPSGLLATGRPGCRSERVFTQ
ncbi:hypothetical protein B0H13DRAFT_2384696 [Mycena leptocephala]|nr:hypothetical protein B0H13DRAFT_2384696 [Mycena leptocephala]